MRSSLFFVALILVMPVAQAGQAEDLRAEVDKLRTEIGKREASSASSSPIGRTESALDSRYGPNATVTTKSAKLTVGGLTQVWYQSIQNDHTGIVRPGGNNALPDKEPNGLNDRDTFRIRRTEIRFDAAISENITGFVMISPTRDGGITYQPVPTFALHNEIVSNPMLASGSGLQLGDVIIPRLLQDAYINFHGVIPHHDFTIGQFKPPAGEESWRNSGQLDFVERAMVNYINNVHDVGVMVHGDWLSGRLQYWAGAFNGSNSYLIDPELFEGGNRTDSNDQKDIAERIAVNPVWSTDKWYGRLQLGGSRTDGLHGESGQGYDLTLATNGLNRQRTWVNRNAAWIWYRPNGTAKGLWVRGEWGSEHDRYDPFFRTNLLNLGSAAGFPLTYPNGDTFSSAGQSHPAPVTLAGYFGAVGYKLSDSVFSERLKNCDGLLGRFLINMEFAFRFESYQNVASESLTNPDRATDLFETRVFTSGVNYYIKGHDAKIQINYDHVMDPQNRNRGIHSYKNDVLVVNFQLMF